MDKMNLIHGDCRDVLQDLINNDVSVDLTVTSPPYDDLRNYNNSLEWDFDIFKEVAGLLYEITTIGGVVVWVVNDKTDKGSETGTSFKQALYFKEIGFRLHDTMIYRKKNPIPLNHNRYEQGFEYMFVLSKGKPKTFNPIKVPCKLSGKVHSSTYYKTDDDKLTKGTDYITKSDKIHVNIFEYAVGGGTGKYKHPAMFPLDLAKDCIISWSNGRDVVLDPFMGSGTVGVACRELNRNFIGIEKVEKYYNIAKKRCKNIQKRLGDF